MEKMAYAVVMVAPKLWHYFQSYKIKVLTSFPLQDMFENREAADRIGKWAAQLTEHTIDFTSRKVSSPGRFHCRLDTNHAFVGTANHRSHLAAQMRWGILHRGSRVFNNLDSTFGHKVEVCSQAGLWGMHQQHCKIRRPLARPSEEQGPGCPKAIH